MTARKSDIALTSRLTAYVSREQGAAELQISPSTWDDLVRRKMLPRPRSIGGLLRWRWADVDAEICKDDAATLNQESFFRERANGPEKDRKRNAAA